MGTIYQDLFPRRNIEIVFNDVIFFLSGSNQSSIVVCICDLFFFYIHLTSGNHLNGYTYWCNCIFYEMDKLERNV